MEDGSYGRYAIGFYGGYMFHSVCYYSMDYSDIEYNEYNKLGGPASLGCVRLCVADAKWLFYEMPYGAKVQIFYDDSSPGPLGNPGSYYIPPEIPQIRGWDPTDSDSGNPWNSYDITVSGDDTINVAAGSSFSIWDYISVKDNYGNDMSDYAKSAGEVDTSAPGTYTVTVSASLNWIYDEKTFTVIVGE